MKVQRSSASRQQRRAERKQRKNKTEEIKTKERETLDSVLAGLEGYAVRENMILILELFY